MVGTSTGWAHSISSVELSPAAPTVASMTTTRPTAGAEYAVRATGLVKRYGKVTALAGVDIAVRRGTVLGLLGPNGAGKTTVVRILATLLRPDEGEAEVAGIDVLAQPGEVRRNIGLSGQYAAVDEYLTGFENLDMIGRLYHLGRKRSRERARELLEQFRLSDSADRPAKTYSGGMRRRLDLALALVHEPRILFLDEPTTGLDPASRRDIWQEIRRLNRELGMTIFLTTQYLEEADELADRVAIINRGQIRVEGTPEALKVGIGGESIELTFADDATIALARSAVAALTDRVQADRRTLRLYLPRAAEAVTDVVDLLGAHGLRPQSLTLARPTLDDVFLQVTGERYEEKTVA